MAFRASSGVAIVAGAALLVSAASLGYVVYRANCSTCGSAPTPKVEPVTGVSDAGNTSIDHIANTLVHQASLSQADADYLVNAAEKSTEVVVQRWALACMAEKLHTQSVMPPEMRAQLERAIMDALSSINDRIAICGIACTEQAGLTERPEFHAKIESLAKDGAPAVADRAARSITRRKPGEG